MGIGDNSLNMLWCTLQVAPFSSACQVIIDQLVECFISRCSHSMVVTDGNIRWQSKGTPGWSRFLIEDIKSQFGISQVKEGIHRKSLLCTWLIKGFILVVLEFREPVQKVQEQRVGLISRFSFKQFISIWKGIHYFVNMVYKSVFRKNLIPDDFCSCKIEVISTLNGPVKIEGIIVCV